MKGFVFFSRLFINIKRRSGSIIIKDLDSVAYVRFASVYREFKDVDSFMSELKKMLEH